MLYLHELIDIIGDGQQPYLDSVGERAKHSERKGISRLMGSWQVIGSTSRWPRVVNLWEMDGWGHWAESLERQFLPDKKDPHLGPWWSAATQFRSGGVDRILEPAEYAPTREQLRSQRLRSWVCVQTVVQLASHARDDYLGAVGDTLRPLLAARGLILMGAYRVPMHGNEALTLWAAPDFRSLCALYAERQSDTALQKWVAYANSLREQWETMWLVPSLHCFFHPGRHDA